MISVLRSVKRSSLSSSARGRAAFGGRLFALFALFAASACGNGGDEHLYVDAGADAGPSKPKVDSKLAAAIAAAESSAKAGGTAQQAEDPNGPPMSGVFAPGKADTLQPPKAPPKLELMNDGQEPKVTLAYEVKDEQKLAVTVGLRIGQQVVPTIDLNLVAKADKGDDKDKAKGKDKDKPKDKDASKDAGQGNHVILKIVGATPAKEQQVQLPKEVAEKLGKLKGSELRYGLSPSGEIHDMTVGSSKDAEGLEMVLRALAEVVSAVTVPLPQKPVGNGAYWMVSDRSSSFGVDVLRYRVVRVQKLEGQSATLGVEIRQYATHDDLDLGGGAPKLFIGRLDSQGKGSELFAGALPKSLDVDEKLQMLITQQKGGQQPQPLIFQLTAKSK